MSNATNCSAQAAQQGQQDEITVNGATYCLVNVTYQISQFSSAQQQRGSLIDGGANGGLLGDDVRILEHVPHAFVNITGVADSEVTNLKLATAAAKVETMANEPVIVIMSQYANLGQGKTIHSKGQMEHFGMLIDNKSRNVGGQQCMITPEGYTIPLHVCDGLPCMDMTIPTDADMDRYPHVFLTADSPWDPTVLDNEFQEEFFNTVTELEEVQEHCDGCDP
jgi:hypothetical protein